MTVYNSLKTNLNEKLKIRLNKKRINTHIINLKQNLISKRKINGDISIRIPESLEKEKVD